MRSFIVLFLLLNLFPTAVRAEVDCSKYAKVPEVFAKCELGNLRNEIAAMQKAVDDDRDNAAMRERLTALEAKLASKETGSPAVFSTQNVVTIPASASFIPRGGEYAAATYCMKGVYDQIGLHGIEDGVRTFISSGYSGPAMVVVEKNGITLSVAHPGESFRDLIADLDGDGVPEATPYQGKAASGNLFVAAHPGETVDVVYLRPIGERGGETVWGNPVRVGYEKGSKPGAWMHLACAGFRR